MGWLQALQRALSLRERRHQVRRSVQWQLVIEHPRIPGGFEALACDASTTAVGFWSNRRPPIGEVVDLQIDFGNGKAPLIASAQIIRCAPARARDPGSFRCAAAFCNLGGTDQAYLLEALAQTSSDGCTRSAGST